MASVVRELHDGIPSSEKSITETSRIGKAIEETARRLAEIVNGVLS
jgi:hypothetical protein